MGEYVIKLPDIGEGVTEAEVVEWMVKPGDVVREDDVLVSVMTDKAAVELPSPVTGTVLSLGAQIGDMLAVGSELLRLAVAGAGNTKPDQTVQDRAGRAAVAPQAAPGAARPTEATTVAGDGVQNEAVLAAQARDPLEAVEGPSAASRTGPDAADMGTVSDTRHDRLRRDGAETAPGRRQTEGTATAAADHTQSTVTDTRRDAAQNVTAPRPEGEKPVASPAVRHRAREAGIDLRQLIGTGPAGRITHTDLGRVFQRTASGANAAQASTFAAAPEPSKLEDATPARPGPQPQSESVKLTGLRRVIAGRMQNAWAHIPHISYVEEVDVTQLESLRAQLNARYAQRRERLTLLPFLMRAIASVIGDYPNMNATFDDAQGILTRSARVHIGIATQSDNGLLVPVIRNVQDMDLWLCATAIESVSGAARAGKAKRDTLSGSTITISSLGALGGIVSTPIINYPEVAIIGVNRIRTLPVYVDGILLPRRMMNLSSSFDHRVVDGHDAASFIQAIRSLLETPTLLFID